jgi:anti-anti-sigma regulatory factor
MQSNDPLISPEALSDPSIQCATLENGCVAVLRVVGRGTFQNSVALGQFSEAVYKQNPSCRYIADLAECSTMDSTFMGTRARIAIRQAESGGGKLVVCNCNENNKRLLKTLGLHHLVDMRQKAPEEAGKAAPLLQPAATGGVGRLDHILHMIEAHEQLVDLDTQNEVRFSNVLKYLRQSLEEESRAETLDDSVKRPDPS